MKTLEKCLFLTLITVIILIIVGCNDNNHNTQPGAERVARELHVPRDRVSELAKLLGVDDDKIPPPPGFPFPLSYFQQQFEAFKLKQGRAPTKTEVEQMVKGYTARCDPNPSRTEYLFFSTKVRPTWLNPEVAIVMVVVYDYTLPSKIDPKDAPYYDMQYIDLADGSVNPSDNPYWENCVEAYLAKSNDGTPTARQ